MTYESYMAESEYLQHHGVLGMKWGVRRYQPYPDNYRGDGKFLGKRERQLSRTQDRIERSVAKARKAAEKGDVKALNKYNKRTERLTKKEQKQIKRVDKARARYEKNAEINAQMEAKEKERLLSKGSTQELVESLGKYDYTDAELNRAYNRINAEVKISSLMDAEKTAKFDKSAETISKITNLGKKALDGYDTYTKIADVVNKATGKDTLPIPGAKAKKEKEKALNEIIRSVDYDKIMENRSKLTPEEFATAMNSITTAAGAKKAYGEALSKYKAGKIDEHTLADKEKEWAKEDKKEAISKAKAEAAREAAVAALTREKAAKERADKGVPDYKSVISALGAMSIAKTSETYDYDKRKTEGLIDKTKVRYIPESFIKEDPDGYFVYDFKKRKEDGVVKHSDISEEFLEHHGVLGMKWGVRRYQRKNGTLTPEGRARYKQDRKDIRKSAGEVRALEENLRNKAQIAAPAQVKAERAKEAYAEALAKHSKPKFLEGKAGRERRAEAIRVAEYAKNEADQNAKRSKDLMNKAEKLYDDKVKELEMKIDKAISKYGDEAVNKLVFSNKQFGVTADHKGSKTFDRNVWNKDVVSNFGYNPFKIKMADISPLVMSMEAVNELNTINNRQLDFTTSIMNQHTPFMM